MNQKSILWVVGIAVLLPGCASIEQAWKDMHKGNDGFHGASVVVESPQSAYGAQRNLPYGLNPVEVLANENVIVYPVDGQIDANKREFPEYRGVMDNTTAGGYTVFDPSVTVFAVEGDAVQRPTYLPEYSVPKYAEQYNKARSTGGMPVQNVASLRAQPLMPMNLDQPYNDEIMSLPSNYNNGTMPRGPRLTTTAGKVSRPWLLDEKRGSGQYNASPEHEKPLPSQPAPSQPASRRSSPMLTGY